MSWKRYIEGTKDWDFATSFSSKLKREQPVSEKTFKWIGHDKCQRNVQVPKSVKRGERFCPNCKELF